MLILTRQYNLTKSSRAAHLPISAVIQAANLFRCDIYIETRQQRINVKVYEELQRGIQPQRMQLIVCFDGTDEEEADYRFRLLFGL